MNYNICGREGTSICEYYSDDNGDASGEYIIHANNIVMVHGYFDKDIEIELWFKYGHYYYHL